MKKYKVLWETPINVNGKERKPGEEFEDELTTSEHTSLIKHRYLEVING